MKKITYRDVMAFAYNNDHYIKDVHPMDHATRLNGVADIFIWGFCVFDVKNKIYHKFEKKADALSMALKIVKENESQHAYSSKSSKTGKISYKTFQKRREESDWRPEEDHWKVHMDKTSEDHLYFVSDGMNRVKIGRSIDPWKRRKGLMTGNASDVNLILVVKNKGCLEKNLHSCFSGLKIKREWFSYTSRIDDFISYVKENTNDFKVLVYKETEDSIFKGNTL